MNIKEAVVLLVDDDPADRELTRRALVSGGVQTLLKEAEDGQVALDYLMRRGKFADESTSPRPDLILLDLNMPVMNGKEFLREIAKTEFSAIPIVILTTSNADVDVQACYDLGCSSFVSKPVLLEDFARAISNIGEYWFQLVKLPPNS